MNKKRRYKPYYKNSKNYTNSHKEEEKNYEICPFCQKEIKNVLGAVIDRDTKKNSHLECVISYIRKDNDIKQNETICYLGGGAYGVVQTKKNRNHFSLNIKEKIQYIERPKKRR